MPGAAANRPVRRLWLRRLGWMFVLWAGGVLTLYLVASLIRAIMHAVGMR
jgi:hypothetical protein